MQRIPLNPSSAARHQADFDAGRVNERFVVAQQAQRRLLPGVPHALRLKTRVIYASMS
jgi:hypothetical protein